MKKLVVLSGAGMSAESGVKTFRDNDGLWEGHDVMEVASPQAWDRSQAMVLDFYNQRRRQLNEVEPNTGHYAIADFERYCEVVVITQNVDDLHERAGSSQVLHLHGELRKVRSTGNPPKVYDWLDDLNEGDLCEMGHQLRPHIVWFGEDVPMIIPAVSEIQTADALIVVGTSLLVYPAAGLYEYAQETAPIFYIDPNPSAQLQHQGRVQVLAERATKGIPRVLEMLRSSDTSFNVQNGLL